MFVLLLSADLFFFNDTATTEIYTLSLHDALPICLDVAGGREVEVGGGDVFGADDFHQTLDVPAGAEGGGDLLDGLVRQEVLGTTFLELTACVDEDDLTPAVGRLGAVVEDDDNAGGGRVVEEIVGQEDDAFDHVLLDEPPAN